MAGGWRIELEMGMAQGVGDVLASPSTPLGSLLHSLPRRVQAGVGWGAQSGLAGEGKGHTAGEGGKRLGQAGRGARGHRRGAQRSGGTLVQEGHGEERGHERGGVGWGAPKPRAAEGGTSAWQSWEGRTGVLLAGILGKGNAGQGTEAVGDRRRWETRATTNLRAESGRGEDREQEGAQRHGDGQQPPKE